MDKKILYFTAAWCGPCRAMAPAIEELSSILNIEKIDVDSKDLRITDFRIKAVPSFILINQQNNELKRIVGLQSKETLINLYND
jgi:thioredoxin 1